MIQATEKLSKDEKFILDKRLFKKVFRCPICNESEARELYRKIWDSSIYSFVFPRKILNSKRFYCFNCKASFDDIKQLALMDGIFLDKNTDLTERTQKYVSELCLELKLSDDVRAKATEILHDYNAKWGCRTVAGASIYISAILCGERRTQREVGDASNVSTLAIRENYVNIAKKLDIGIL